MLLVVVFVLVSLAHLIVAVETNPLGHAATVDAPRSPVKEYDAAVVAELQAPGPGIERDARLYLSGMLCGLWGRASMCDPEVGRNSETLTRELETWYEDEDRIAITPMCRRVEELGRRALEEAGPDITFAVLLSKYTASVCNRLPLRELD